MNAPSYARLMCTHICMILVQAIPVRTLSTTAVVKDSPWCAHLLQMDAHPKPPMAVGPPSPQAEHIAPPELDALAHDMRVSFLTQALCRPVTQGTGGPLSAVNTQTSYLAGVIIENESAHWSLSNIDLACATARFMPHEASLTEASLISCYARREHKLAAYTAKVSRKLAQDAERLSLTPASSVDTAAVQAAVKTAQSLLKRLQGCCGSDVQT